jgi:hypothetical protein
MILKRGDASIAVTATYPVTIGSIPHQNRGISENDTSRTYHRGTWGEIISIPLIIKDVELAPLRTFIKRTVMFSLHEFYITPDAGHDIGNGSGGAILVKWWGDDFTENRSVYGFNAATLTVKRFDVNPWAAGDYADDIDMPEELEMTV